MDTNEQLPRLSAYVNVCRDDVRIDAHRLGFWGADISPFLEWRLVGKGGYGKVFLVPIFPPLSIRGERVTEIVIKAAIANASIGDLNPEIEVSIAHIRVHRRPSVLCAVTHVCAERGTMYVSGFDVRRNSRSWITQTLFGITQRG